MLFCPKCYSSASVGRFPFAVARRSSSFALIRFVKSRPGCLFSAATVSFERPLAPGRSGHQPCPCRATSCQEVPSPTVGVVSCVPVPRPVPVLIGLAAVLSGSQTVLAVPGLAMLIEFAVMSGQAIFNFLP